MTRLFGLILPIFILSGCASALKEPRAVAYFHDDYLSGLYTDIDTSDEKSIFELVFRQLKPTSVIYPTEHYYYWMMPVNSVVLSGNIRLAATDRDDGIVHFGYFEYDAIGKVRNRNEYYTSFDASDGIKLKKLSPTRYLIEFNGTKKYFNIKRPDNNKPNQRKLLDDETWVGPVVDESGLLFHLVFNRAGKYFLFLLNEDSGTADFFRQKGPLLIGRRTGFAFYDDKDLERKVLVGVYSWHVDRNNYYDGPFDQLPDDFADHSRLQEYLEQANPDLAGTLDKFGGFKGNKLERFAISAYVTYTEGRDLAFVESCIARYRPARPIKLYRCVTGQSDVNLNRDYGQETPGHIRR